MIKYALVSLSLVLGLSLYAPAQSAPDKQKRSQDVQAKMHQLDLLIKILPLILTKTQIDDFLVPIEKAHEKEAKILTSEDDEILNLEDKVNAAVKDGIDKGAYPPRTLSTDIYALTKALAIRRQVARNEIVDDLYAVVQKDLNDGQKKAMAGSFAAIFIDPKAKPADVKDEQKIRFYLQNVFLDPATYDLLTKLREKAAS